MALYEYQCLSCGDVFEVIQKMSDDPLSTCEKCDGALKKLLSAPAFQFKGSGWYVTDYAKKSGDNGKGDSGAGDSKAGSDAKSDGDSSKSDGDSSKSETKTSSKTAKPEAKTKSERISD